MGFISKDLIFREIEPQDLDFLRRIRNSPDMNPGWRTPVSVQTPQQQEAWYRTLGPQNQAFIACPADKVGEGIGLLRFKLDGRICALTGTDVLPQYQGLGFGRKILFAGAQHAFRDLGCHRVTAESLKSNIPARKIIEHVGFRFEGTLRSSVWRNGEWQDWLIYSLIEGELCE